MLGLSHLLSIRCLRLFSAMACLCVAAVWSDAAMPKSFWNSKSAAIAHRVTLLFTSQLTSTQSYGNSDYKSREESVLQPTLYPSSQQQARASSLQIRQNLCALQAASCTRWWGPGQILPGSWENCASTMLGPLPAIILPQNAFCSN